MSQVSLGDDIMDDFPINRSFDSAGKLLQTPSWTEAFVRRVLAPAIVVERVQPLPQSALLPVIPLAEKRMDHLVEVTLNYQGQRTQIIVDIENQAQPDTDMDWRSLFYTVAVLDDQHRQQTPGFPVIPYLFVLNLYRTGKSQPITIEKLQLQETIPVFATIAGLTDVAEIIRYHYLAFNLDAFDPAWFESEIELLPLQVLAQGDARKLLMRVLRRLLADITDRAKQKLLIEETLTFASLRIRKMKDLRESVYQEVHMLNMRDFPLLDEMWREGLEEGLEKGVEKGREEGREQGREEAREEAARTAILCVLTHRFGQVPESLETTLSGRLHPQLTSLIDLALDASSLDAFLNALAGSPA